MMSQRRVRTVLHSSCCVVCPLVNHFLCVLLERSAFPRFWATAVFFRLWPARVPDDVTITLRFLIFEVYVWVQPQAFGRAADLCREHAMYVWPLCTSSVSTVYVPFVCMYAVLGSISWFFVCVCVDTCILLVLVCNFLLVARKLAVSLCGSVWKFVESLRVIAQKTNILSWADRCSSRSIEPRKWAVLSCFAWFVQRYTIAIWRCPFLEFFDAKACVRSRDACFQTCDSRDVS